MHEPAFGVTSDNAAASFCAVVGPAHHRSLPGAASTTCAGIDQVITRTAYRDAGRPGNRSQCTSKPSGEDEAQLPGCSARAVHRN